MLSSSILFCVPLFRQVQNYCASWALPTRYTFLFKDEVIFYSRVHVHATQKREICRPEAVFKVVVRREAEPITTKELW